MKGPGFRYDVDVRRVWACPACGQRMRLPATQTSRLCKCTPDGHWMQIVDEHLRRTFPVREMIVIPEPEEVIREVETPPVPAVAETDVAGDSGLQQETHAGEQPARHDQRRNDSSPRESGNSERHRQGKDRNRSRADRPQTPSGESPVQPPQSPSEPPPPPSVSEPPPHVAPPPSPPEEDGFGANIF